MGRKQDVCWAPRVPQEWIRRLYSQDAQGMRDEDWIDEVGWALRARCVSFLDTVEALHGRAPCPKCATVILHGKGAEEVLTCPNCGWSLAWREYHSTFQHQQLSGAGPVLILFRAYVDGFLQANGPEEKMLFIDRLIHGFHWLASQERETRTTGINLIQGSYHEVVDFLDDLTYGPGSTPGTLRTWEVWREVIQRTGDEHLPRDRA